MAHRIGQTVRAQQVPVTGAGFAHDERGLHLVTGQRPHDQRPLRVAVRLFESDTALVDQRLNERVVLGNLVELAVAKQVTARVPDVHESKSIAREQDRGQGRAHTLEFGVGVDIRGDRGIAVPDRGVELVQQVAARLVVIEVGQCRDHQLGGDLTGGVTAHAVGERKQARAGVHGVLVVRADQAAIAAGCVSEHQCHGRSSITVLPIRTGVPIGTRTAVVTFALSRYVPLVDPRSSTYHSEPRGDSLACRVEA